MNPWTQSLATHKQTLKYAKKYKDGWLGMVVNALIPALRQKQADLCELESSLVYIARSYVTPEGLQSKTLSTPKIYINKRM